jgi:pyruvate/2-oxoglutarate dehydrogenase complex dihydrolipoamide dehydrogenase (E3) component
LPQEFDVVCLGGGVAGEAIAAGFRDSGLTLAVVERELVGGECPCWGCVPSKTLLRSGETLSEADRARLLADSCVEWSVDFSKVSKRVLWMARNLDDSRPAAGMGATGTRLFRGEGKLTDLRTGAVGREQLVARRAVVIANGSTVAIAGELVLAIKLRTPLKALADLIHPFPGFNRVLGASLEELAVKAALQHAAQF